MSVNKLDSIQQTPEQTNQQKIANFLNTAGVKKQISTMAAHLDADKLANLALNEVRKNPKLAECSTTSLLGGILQCAALGLDPDSNKKQVYLIPYENREKSYKDNRGQWQKGAVIDTQLQIQISFIGMQTLINRNPDVQKITSRIVYANDEFECEYGLDETLKHKPSMQADSGPLTHAYAVVHMKDGTKIFEVMSKDQINHVALTSKTVQGIKDDGTLNATTGTPWAAHYEEMARKTVFRRLFKWLPQVEGLMEAASIEDQADHASMWNPDVIEGVSKRTEQSKPKPKALPQDKTEPIPMSVPAVTEEADQDDGQVIDRTTGEVLKNNGPLSQSTPETYPVNPDDGDDMFADTGF